MNCINDSWLSPSARITATHLQSKKVLNVMLLLRIAYVPEELASTVKLSE